MRRSLTALAILSLSLPALAQAAPADIGEQAPRLRFVDIRYLPRTLEDCQGEKATVLFFTSVECPLVRRYMPRVVKLEAAYRERGVRVVAVNVGSGDSVVAMAAQAVDHGAPFPFVKDFSGKSLKALGVERTVTCVVLDAERRLRYRGRIDDQYRFGGVRPQATRSDLREALDDVLAARDVRVATTPVDGCKVSFAAPAAPALATPEFADVAPVLDKHCVQCHRPGTEAPFELTTYEKTSAHADMIGEVVKQGRMPPWFASEGHGTFENARGLSAAERKTILDWVRAGAPRGDSPPRDRTPPPPPSRWAIGEPDLVIKVAREAKLPAEGYVNYKYEFLPYTFKEDTWISHVQISPENSRVLHHANLAYILPTQGRKSWFITGQVPGGYPMALSEGQGFLIPKGALLVLQIHYVTTGQPERDRLSVGIRFPRWTVKKQIKHLRINNGRFAIPPGASHHEVRASKTLPTDAEGIAMFSHMHLRGKDMRFVAHYPDGKQETVLLIPNYNFDWQLAYRWPEGTRRFPKGTRIECVGHFDNSSFNPYNPDPKKVVRFGEQTYHEMFYGFFFYTDPNEELNITVDSKTGHVAPSQPARRYFK